MGFYNGLNVFTIVSYNNARNLESRRMLKLGLFESFKSYSHPALFHRIKQDGERLNAAGIHAKRIYVPIFRRFPPGCRPLSQQRAQARAQPRARAQAQGWARGRGRPPPAPRCRCPSSSSRAARLTWSRPRWRPASIAVSPSHAWRAPCAASRSLRHVSAARMTCHGHKAVESYFGCTDG